MALTDTDRPDRYDAATPWHLQGNNAPVLDEVTLSDLDVIGALPTELSGLFLRNGANPQTGMSQHWFIGDGMVHGLSLSNGKAQWYRNRYVRTPMHANPGADRTELSLDPETFEMDLSVSAANTHVIEHHGRILALEEGGYPYELTPELETVGPYTFGGALGTAMTAHPKVCPETGELLFFGYGVMGAPFMTYHRADAQGNLMQSTGIDMGGPTMIHDFAVSRNHVVAMDLPMVFDLELAMQGGMPIRWSDDYQARMGVMSRTGDGSDMMWFDVDPCYVFHTLNAHDEGDEVVMRGCRLNRLWMGSADMDDSDNEAARLHEWRFNLATGHVVERALDDEASEFPRMTDAEVGFDNRWGYCLSMKDEEKGGSLFKYDLHNDAERTEHSFEPGQTPGEPIFVAAEGATSSDDGWIMTFVYDRATDLSSFVVLDATDMSAAPVAMVPLPVRVPTGFHGSWVAR